MIFLGYPIWWNLCPRPVNTFLEKYDFSGKTVIPFATSGGSSITNSVKQLKKLYPKIVWGESRLLNGSDQAGRRLGERSNIKMATENIFTKYDEVNRAEVIVNILMK